MLTLSAGLLLPWLVGATWLARIESFAGGGRGARRSRQAGYGFFLGYALLTLVVLALRAWQRPVSWTAIMAILSALAIAALAVRPGRKAGRAAQAEVPLLRPLDTAGKSLLLVLALWAGLHLLLLTIEAINLPVFPWDAWETWVYRAKALYLSGGMAEFTGPAGWARTDSPDVYPVVATNYPPLATIIPYWAALSLGQWSETLVNLPVILAGIAIGLALYGQCRESGIGVLPGVVAVYLLFSIPLFGTHIALAGYADIWMAGFTGLGFIALVRGARAGNRYQGALGLVMVALAMLVKNEGAVWFLAALLMQALIVFRWRAVVVAGSVVLVVVAVGYLTGVTHVKLPLLGTIGAVDGRLVIPFVARFTLEVHNVWQAYADNFFTMGSWNLLWVLTAAALLLAVFGRTRHAGSGQGSAALFIIVFAATQIFIFGFTDQGAWADTYTAINRLPIHFVPALIFAAVVILSERLSPPERSKATGSIRGA